MCIEIRSLTEKARHISSLNGPGDRQTVEAAVKVVELRVAGSRGKI
jgi:hypothetical protein